jgi:hypothetical protein
MSVRWFRFAPPPATGFRPFGTPASEVHRIPQTTGAPDVFERKPDFRAYDTTNIDPMKTAFCLFLLAAGSALAQELNLDKAPLLDAPGPGYRREPLLADKLNLVSPSLRRPAVSMLQATTIADREMKARGLAEDFILRSVTLVRGAQNGDSFYQAILTPHC